MSLKAPTPPSNGRILRRCSRWTNRPSLLATITARPHHTVQLWRLWITVEMWTRCVLSCWAGCRDTLHVWYRWRSAEARSRGRGRVTAHGRRAGAPRSPPPVGSCATSSTSSTGSAEIVPLEPGWSASRPVASRVWGASRRWWGSHVGSASSSGGHGDRGLLDCAWGRGRYRSRGEQPERDE